MKKDKSFVLRFSLETEIPPELWEDDEFEEDQWLAEWEARIKPGLIRTVFSHLRSFDGWDAHVRNRGVPSTDEIEVVVTHTIAPPNKPVLQ